MNHTDCISLVAQFSRGERSAVDIVRAYLNRIDKYDTDIKAFLAVCTESALNQAQTLDEKRKKGEPLGRLAGVPIAIKDNINVKGTITSCGSKILENYRSPYDATVVELLKNEDAIIIGKTNMDEFAMGSSNEHSAFFTTKNPWNLACSPGGSSGGSCAAVAARLAPLALGSDTGGSVRQPASFTGVVGFKPTYGRVSRYGLVAFGSSLDQIGPIANSCQDIALTMEIIGCHCEKDSTSIPQAPEPILSTLTQPIKGLRFGVPWQFLEALHADARKVFDTNIALLKSMGAQIVDIDLSILKYSIAVYYILATAEASTNLARFDGIRYGKRAPEATTLDEIYEFSRQEGFGDEVKRRILLGTFVLSAGYQDAYYKKAQKVRRLIIDTYHQAFTQCDLIALPVSPFTAFELGAIKDPLQMYLADIYTIGANLAGLPAISVPAGFGSDQKPIGLQFIGPQLFDAQVIRAGHQFEQEVSIASHLPPLITAGS